MLGLTGRRTRDAAEPESALRRIQQLSNCRVQVQRGSEAVQLLGQVSAVAAAWRLLDELQRMCMEALVEFSPLPPEEVKSICAREGVSSMAEGAWRCRIYGLRQQVQHCLNTLRHPPRHGPARLEPASVGVESWPKQWF